MNGIQSYSTGMMKENHLWNSSRLSERSAKPASPND
jgi:hypothetical protein